MHLNIMLEIHFGKVKKDLQPCTIHTTSIKNRMYALNLKSLLHNFYKQLVGMHFTP